MIIIMLAVSMVMYFIQDKLIFHAEKLPINYEFQFNTDFLEINLQSKDGQSLSGLLFKIKSPQGIVIFFHNHSGNIEHCNRYALLFNKMGYEVLMMDYRGFGKSTGKYNEKAFLKDSELWYNYALEKYDHQFINVYGRGLGATFACYVASLNKPKRLFLESPFYDFIFLGKNLYPFLPVKWISKYQFKTSQYYSNVRSEIHIFHGKMNEFIDYKNSSMLYNLSEENSQLYLIPNGNHYNLINNKFYLEKIKEIFSA